MEEILSNPQINDRFVFNTGQAYLVLLLREFEDDLVFNGEASGYRS